MTRRLKMCRLMNITPLILILLIVRTQANPLSFPDASNSRSSPYEGRTYDSQGREIPGKSDTSARSLNGYQSNRNQIDISNRPNSNFNRLLSNRQPFALKYDDDDYDDTALPDKPENSYNAYNRPQSTAAGYTNSKYGGFANDNDYDDTEDRHGHKFKKGKHKRKYQQQPCIPVPFSGSSYRNNARDVGSGRTLPLFNIYYNQPYGGGGYPAGYQDPSSNRPQYSHTGGYLCVPQYGGGGGGFGGGPLGFFGQGGLLDFTSSGVAPQRPQRPISSASGSDNYNDGVGSYRPPIADIVQSAGGNVVEIVNALRPGDVLGSVANILNAVANRIGGVVGGSFGSGSFGSGTFGSGSFGSGSIGSGSIGSGSIGSVVSPVSSVGGGVSPVVETGSSSVDSGLVSGIADIPNDPVNDNVIRKIGREYWSLFT